MRIQTKLAIGLMLFLAASAVYANPQLTLNKKHEPGPIAIGAPITYVISLSNALDPNAHVSITDTLPPGFVFVSATCTALLPGASCPTGPLTPPTFGEFVLPQGGNVTAIELRITGYFQTGGPKTNSAVATAKDDNGNPVTVCGSASTCTTNMSTDSVTVPFNLPPVDLKIEKCVQSGSACTATSTMSFPAKMHYVITVTNKTAQDVYLGGLLTIRDNLSNLSGVSINWNAGGNYSCTPSGNAVCPNSPFPLSGILPVGSTAQFGIGYAANNSGYLPGNSSYVIEFDVDATTADMCRNGTPMIENEAFLSFASGLGDTTSTDNSSQQVTTTINTALAACPPPPPSLQASKIQVSPAGNMANWSAPVRYRVTLTNPAAATAAATNVPLTDEIYKLAGTPPFTATVTSGPTCISGCTMLMNPVLQSPSVTADLTVATLWTATLPSLAPAQTAVIEYEVIYVPVCESDARQDGIVNRFWGGTSISQPVQTNLPEAAKCDLQVEKTMQTPGPIVFEQPFTYQVVYSNLSAMALNVGTVRDVLSITSNQYGTLPFNYSVSCIATAGTVTPLPVTQSSPGTAQYQQFGWQGARLINAALTFSPGAVLTCQVTVTAHRPPDNNPYCQGAGNPQLVNAAYMDLTSNYNENTSHQPDFYSSQAADLPLCRNLIVSKTANAQNFAPGAPITYTITVENKGNHPVASFTLKDVIQPPLVATGVTACNPSADCTTGPTLTGNQVDVAYGLLTPNQPVSFDIQVTAPQAGGSYPNLAQGAFLPGGNFYFQGDEAHFLQQEENIQVVTPTMAKSFDLGTIAPGGTAMLVFTVTNTNGDPQQNGLAFIDTLPSGLQADSVSSNGCGGTVSLSTNGQAITLTGGQLNPGSHSCQIAVVVKATGVCGTLVNDRSNFSGVTNLDVSNAIAQLEVAGAACEPSEDVDVSLVTGFDEVSGKRLARGAADDDWTVSVGGQPAQPARLVQNPPTAWPRFRPSDWISTTATGASPPGGAPVRFERCFCIAADATNAKLTLNLWADDQATVLLNGVPVSSPGGQFRRADSLSVLYMGTVGGSLFKPGNNCVAVEIDDLRPRYVGLDIAGRVWIDHGKCDGASY